MRKNRLGSSNLYVTEIGFGCMSIGTDERKAESLIHEALDLGINYFDTADLYDFGKNEEIVGKALKGRRQDVILATKVGNRWRSGRDGWDWDPSKTYIIHAVKDSLHRLNTDYIDLYQLHGGTIEDNIEETIEAFEQLKQEGVIREYGISSIRPNVIREYVKKSQIVSVMLQYSLLDRRPEEEVLPLLHDNDISAIARGPLAKGLLAGKMKKAEKEGYMGYSYEELKALSAGLNSHTDENRSMGQLALRYPLHHPSVASVIPGASNIEQVRHNASAGLVDPLSDSEIKSISSLTRQNKYDAHR